MSLLALQDLFRRYREKATGVWKLGQEPGRTIYFDYGDAVFAQSTHLQDRLTYILVERGKVTQAQMDYALANLKAGLSIGKNLIEMGFITQRDLLEVAKAQVERIICGSLATSGQEPVFEAKDLDANVVRLPLNTAQVFLTGVLALQNREGLLEMLGPLNQVVVLQSRSLMDLTLPPDLAKLPPLLDGTHTLLELSRESMAEPVRLGAFALFLREMGWARLHEMPPLDRHALDLAFTPEPEPLSAPLADAFPETVPSLFATIQEAARPTTNLEHLSQSLDADPLAVTEPDERVAPTVPEGVYLPEGLLALPAPEVLPDPSPAPAQDEDDLTFPWATQVATGQAEMPTPAMELPPVPEEEPEEPRVVLHVPLDEPEAPAPPPEPVPDGPSPLPKLMMGVLLAAVLVAGGVFLLKRKGRSKPAVPPAAAPVVVPPVAEPVKPKTEPEVKSAAEPVPEPAPEPPAKAVKPEPKPEPPKPAAKVSTTIHDRLEALAKGDLALAVRQGGARMKEIPGNHWALRLEIACQGDTIRRVSEVFKGDEPDLYLLPMTLRDGRTCYQVLYGNFPSKDAAEKRVKHLPAPFLADRNRPKAFRLDDLPTKQ
jgi:hypothetical protein